MSLTEPQLRAVSSQSQQTLVSAAAGSGKTHVLTKRIEALVRGADMDGFAEDDGTQVNPQKMEDISRMLVMTFTRAAAAEMRGRIVDTLTKAAQKQTELGHDDTAQRLRRQAEAAAGADISTVHSFCTRVIAENYDLADVSAGFGILSQDQATQLMESAAREVLDERYENDDQDVVRLLKKFTLKGRDEQLVEILLRIYSQMMGMDDWEAWLELPFAPDRPQQMMQHWEQIRISELEHAIEALERAERLTRRSAEESGDKSVLKKADADTKLLARFRSVLSEAREKGADAAAPGIGKLRFSNTKDMPGALHTAYRMREESRTAVTVFLSADFDGADTGGELSAAHEDLRALTDLVRSFAARYAQKKSGLNKVDYADLEHKALKVLRILRAQGRGYDRKYRHVFVDEYQDTNKVQESILRELTGDNQVFMVGDLKQSIYGFRFADPGIFREKDIAFPQRPGEAQQCIHMNHNFRSSPAVVDTVNIIMGRLMRESLGGVEYGEDEELIYQRQDEEPGFAQILIADESAGAISEDGKASDELEAEMIASRIAELYAEGRQFGDMAILLRSRSARVGAIETALESRGIPYAADIDSSRSFSELDVFLNLLELVVNERRDVPLLSVMRSYIGGFDEADFARIVNWNDENPEEGGPAQRTGQTFFRRLARYRAAEHTGSDRNLANRIQVFFDKLDKLRVMGTDMALARFAEEVGARYDFGSYLLTRPAGASRRKAYDALLQMISEQQEIHGNSLYRVLAAVRRARRAAPSDAQSASGSLNAVRIMTIHQSKGLEIPIVFVAGTDRAFNRKSITADYLLTDAYGVTVKYINDEKHIKQDTVETAVVRRYIESTQLSEELRMLYVAMTRAKDQLYLCGSAAGEEQSENTWRNLAGRYEYASSMLDWIMGAYYELEEAGQAPEGLYQGSFWRHGQAVGAAAAGEEPEDDPDDVIALLDEAVEEHRTDFYGLAARARVAAVQGVSKRIAADRREQDAQGTIRPPYAKDVRRPVLPEPSDGVITGAERGTLLHKALQYAVRTHTQPASAVAQMLERRLITREESDELQKSLGALDAFFESPLYARAAASKNVLIEQPFEYLLPAPSDADYSGRRMRLRGKIDLAFIEDDEWVLVDYKSDRAASAEELAARYAPQIEYYKEALEKITGCPVRESYLFSLERSEAIPV